MKTNEPKPIPRKLCCRILAGACHDQVRTFQRLVVRTQRVRPGATLRPSKEEGRAVRSRDLAERAYAIESMMIDKDLMAGPGIDAAIVGYLVALAYGHADAFAELREELIDGKRVDLLSGLCAVDLVAIVSRILH